MKQPRGRDAGLPRRAPRAATRERRDGKSVFGADRTFGVRVGCGGFEIEFDAFNGDIRIVERGD